VQKSQRDQGVSLKALKCGYVDAFMNGRFAVQTQKTGKLSGLMKGSPSSAVEAVTGRYSLPEMSECTALKVLSLSGYGRISCWSPEGVSLRPLKHWWSR